MKPPRPDQTTAIDQLVAAEERALSVRACGTGKTLVGREVARRKTPAGGVILVTVPSKALVRQMYRDWEEEWGAALDVLLVYSDPAVGQAAATTAPEDIAAFIRTRTSRTRLIVSTYQSAERIANAYAAEPSLPPLDAMILDEVHVTAGQAGKKFSIVLDDTRIPTKYRVGLTATARNHNGDGTQDAVSMEDVALYGERIPDLTFGQAIAQELLSDYMVAMVLVTDKEIHQALSDQNAYPRGREVTASQVAAQIAVGRAIEEYGTRRALGFHSRVERSRGFTDTLARTARRVTSVPVKALHIDANSSPAAREAALEQLAHPANEGATVLSNVAVLTVGVDVPAVDCVVFADPRTSIVAITQAVGRALRLSPGKSRKSVIVLPVVLAPGESPEQVLADSEFRHVYAVLSALRDFDERMDSGFTTAAVDAGVGEFAGEVNPRLPDAIDILGLDADLHSKMHEALTLHVLTNVTESWLVRYGKLKAYMEYTGEMPRSAYVSPQRDAIGAFAATQQTANNKGTLPPSRRALLEQLPGWHWRGRRDISPKIDDQELTALAARFHKMLMDRTLPEEERRQQLIAMAYECSRIVPRFKFSPSRYRAYVTNAVTTMEGIWKGAEKLANKRLQQMVNDEATAIAREKDGGTT
ncbi:DEAD/DEAH box helicase [Streptomyces sp. CBMA29]|uniref:DEAD/DEAH box helicase n=1 Tax=Streptomyces sp. CBMA29 TaxID=1896314 RepID=UPI001661F563|nr:DEAD/DEAH box helicase [Streptomyces sp. CBMA29]MBD0733983.1 hypothetical protein [Streptomyces sp. CBMA29]